MFKTWNHVYHKHKQKRDKDINCLKVDDQQATDPFVMSNNLK